MSKNSYTDNEDVNRLKSCYYCETLLEVTDTTCRGCDTSLEELNEKQTKSNAKSSGVSERAPASPSSALKDEDREVWLCSDCSLKNEASVDTCAACSTGRYPIIASSSNPHSESLERGDPRQDINCRRCGRKNPEGEECRVCLPPEDMETESDGQSQCSDGTTNNTAASSSVPQKEPGNTATDHIQTWSCSSCTMINNSNCFNCVTCLTPNPNERVTNPMEHKEENKTKPVPSNHPPKGAQGTNKNNWRKNKKKKKNNRKKK